MPKGVWRRPRTPGEPPKRTTTARNWTRQQMELLEDQYGRIPNEVLAAKLGRTVWGMQLKAVKMGVRPWKYTQLCKDDLQSILGSDDNRGMKRWIAAGWLKPRLTRGRGRGGFRFLFTEAQLIAFLEGHGDQVDRRRVDPAYQRYVEQWLSSTEVFRRGGPDPNDIARAAGELSVEVRLRGIKRMVRESDLEKLIEWRRRRCDDSEHLRRRIRRERLHRRTLAKQRIDRSA